MSFDLLIWCNVLLLFVHLSLIHLMFNSVSQGLAPLLKERLCLPKTLMERDLAPKYRTPSSALHFLKHR